jgi:peptidoglycan/LPS O-acetylase OafA/YrhL
MGLGAAMLVACSIGLPWFQTFLSRPFVQFLGRISFSLYLLHRVFIVILAPRIDLGSTLANLAVLYTGVFAISIILSAIFERVVDRPSVALGRVASGWLMNVGKTRKESRA